LAYARKYFLEFLNRQNVVCTVWILEKDYQGAFYSLEGAENSFVLDYKSGDNNATTGIRGSVATIQFYNNGGTPLSSFVSNNDDHFKVEFYYNTVLFWSGFLVQDDSMEPMVRPARYIVSLSATDNIGLLKDTPFGWINPDLRQHLYVVGDIIKFCLNKTGLNLNLNIFCNVFEERMNDRSVNPNNEPFSQCRISAKTFLKDESTFEDCYSVLNKILSAWNCTLFQTEGEWQIVRWHEMKDFRNVVPGSRYDYNYVAIGPTTTQSYVTVGSGYTVMPLRANHTRGLIRPDKYEKLTFNYEQPYKMLLNDDLLSVGSLITTYPYIYQEKNNLGVMVDKTGHIDEYEMLYWDVVIGFNNPTKFIRVLYNELGIEKERYAVVKGGAAANQKAVRCTDIDVNAKDKISYSFKFRTSDSQAGNVNNIFVIQLTDGASTYYLNSNQQWVTAQGAVFNVPSGDDTNQWHDVTFDSDAIPIDGKLIIYLYQADVSGSVNETQYKDFRFTYTYFVNDSTQITGHIHKSEQKDTPKNKTEETIYTDDAPKNSMKGVMFLFDGVNKTTTWKRGITIGTAVTDFQTSNTRVAFVTLHAFTFTDFSTLTRFAPGVTFSVTGSASNNGTFTVTRVIVSQGSFTVFVKENVTSENVTAAVLTFTGERRQFGFIQKVDLMFLNQSSRLKIEGDYFGLQNISLLRVIEWDTMPGIYFIMGQVSFNYMKCEWTGTLEELWRNTAVYDFNLFDNTFTYIYKTR
jgi:hypothetical protein